MNNKFRLDEDSKQINMFDERWYEITTPKETFYFPSVTTYLEAFPKGFGYTDWLQNVGKNADAIMTEAGQKGTETHNLIETVLKGGQAFWQEGVTQIQVWENFMCWCEWFKNFTKENDVSWESENVEQKVWSVLHKCAGTIDWAPVVNGKRVLFDWKTSKAMYESYELQLAAYSILFTEMYGEEIESANVLLLGKALNKKGFRLHEQTEKEIENNFEDFQHVQKIWNRVNKNAKPKFKQYPTNIDLDFIKNNEIITLKGA